MVRSGGGGDGGTSLRRKGKRTRGQPIATATVRVRLYCCCCCPSVIGPRVNSAEAVDELENIARAEPDGDEIATNRTEVLE